MDEESESESQKLEELKKKQVDLDRIVPPKESKPISYEQVPVAKSLSFAVRDSCFCLFESERLKKRCLLLYSPWRCYAWYCFLTFFFPAPFF